MKRVLSLAILTTLLFAGSAHAATLNINLGNLPNTVTYGVGLAFAPNVDLSNPSPNGLSLFNNAQVINPATTVPNQYLAPTGSLYQNNYLAVLGTGNPGIATFTLASNNNTLGFTWGTIDLYNTLILTDSRSQSYVLTGADILAQIGNPTPGSTTSQTNVHFSDSFGSIVTATFFSSKNSFEVANFAVSNVPLPPAVILFGLALASLLMLARRNRTRS